MPATKVKSRQSVPQRPNKAYKAIVDVAPKRPFPLNLGPMLATLVNEPFSSSEWSYEVKWDGYRALAFIKNGQVELKSRNAKSFNEKFYSVFAALQQSGLNAVIDGEIVVTNAKGLSNFGGLQNWRSEADGELIYYVFDVLWLDGRDLTKLALSERRAVLRSVLPPTSELIRLSENFDEPGTKAFETARKLGFEGIMAKRNDSVYLPGERSKEWLKIKANRRQEVVIGGFTKNEGSNKPFSSLLVGVFKGKKLQYTGKIGTGFSIKTQKELLQQFKPLIRSSNPFSSVPDINSPSRFRPDPPKATATWLKPELVCEVSFTEMTADAVMRHPSFEGMRIDKRASEVELEPEKETTVITRGHKILAGRKIITPPKSNRKTLLNPTDESQVRNIGGHDLKLSNLSKFYWSEEKISKRDLINYYYQIAPYMLPYLKDRPQSLNRHPNGIHGEHFYQKDVKGKVPEWIHTFRYYSETDKREKEFFICDDEASLIFLANLGCIEISPWNSTAGKPDNPDWCVIDLDPDQNTFNQVIKAAQVTHELFEWLGVPSYCKTSGASGLHIYVPLGAKYTYEQSKEFARAIVTVVHSRIPSFTSIERQIADRGGKMYLDFLQNRPQATIVAPYSVRPKPGATVSMPLHWEEVKAGLKISDFTIKNARERISKTGEMFKPIIGKGIDLNKALRKLLKI
jgi:bifunctional non-homologous end joining protein LigD